ncbi:hypothetical protein [Nonomuraea sp. CA-141351]|uniref:hypothetical protein n=1 Tax=Nonomuraea sp. CA-141351 TaxID=3239996 RepID=UPI003D9168F7
MTRPPDLARIAASVDELVRAGDTRRLRTVHRQLKSAVDRKRLAERRRLYAANPVGWLQRRLNQAVWSKQAEILESARDHRRTAVRSGHGVGKRWTAALVASWWLDTHPPGEAFVVSTAPTFSQVRAILWRYIRKHHRAAGLGPDCRILAIDPDNPASRFRRVCTPGSGWHQIRISAFDSPNLTGEPVPPAMATALVGRVSGGEAAGVGRGQPAVQVQGRGRVHGGLRMAGRPILGRGRVPDRPGRAVHGRGPAAGRVGRRRRRRR